MSRTTILAIYPGEKCEPLIEFRNAWLSAPLVWNALSMKYLGHKPYLFSGLDALWDLWKRGDIPEPVRAVHMMTFDRAYVMRKDYAKAASNIREFLREFPDINPADNHWCSIAAYYDLNPKVPAIGLWCTSVSQNPFLGEWNEEKEEYGPLDWNTAFDLYAELGSL